MNKILLITGIALIAGSLFLFNQSAENQGPLSQVSQSKFSDYQKKFNKKYSSQSELSFRQAVFDANMQDADISNADPKSTFTLGMTQFSDLTQEEFVAQYLTLKVQDVQKSAAHEVYEDKNFASNGAVDWRNHPGVSTHVKNQGQCGSCWAFSTVGAVEAFLALSQNMYNIDLSEQQLVHCQTGGSFGCSGGWPDLALQYVADHGLVESRDYPYTARDGACQREGGPYKINKPVAVAADENSLKSAIEQRPVSVCVDASNWSQYTGGILNNCGSGLNHAVLAFGYDAGYWIVKNSWGQGWGETGFIRVKEGNTCNILSHSYLAA